MTAKFYSIEVYSIEVYSIEVYSIHVMPLLKVHTSGPHLAAEAMPPGKKWIPSRSEMSGTNSACEAALPLDAASAAEATSTSGSQHAPVPNGSFWSTMKPCGAWKQRGGREGGRG